METFYHVLAVIIGPVVGILVYGLIESVLTFKIVYESYGI